MCREAWGGVYQQTGLWTKHVRMCLRAFLWSESCFCSILVQALVVVLLHYTSQSHRVVNPTCQTTGATFNSSVLFFLFQSFNLVIRDVTLPVCKKLYPWKHLSGYMGRIHKTLCKKPNLHKQSLWEENKQKKPLQTLCSWLLLLKFCISLPLIPHILLFSPFWISIHAFYHRFHFVLSCLARYVLTHNRLWTDDTLGWFICC